MIEDTLCNPCLHVHKVICMNIAHTKFHNPVSHMATYIFSAVFLRMVLEANLEMENLGKRSGITDLSITQRIQEIEKRTSGVEDTIEEIDTIVKENPKHKTLRTKSIQKIKETMKKKLKMSSTKS